MRTEITRRRPPRHWPLTGKFHGDTDRRLVAYSVEKLDRVAAFLGGQTIHLINFRGTQRSDVVDVEDPRQPRKGVFQQNRLRTRFLAIRDRSVADARRTSPMEVADGPGDERTQREGYARQRQWVDGSGDDQEQQREGQCERRADRA